MQDRPQTIWKTIAAEKPDVFACLGDNIYADTYDLEEMIAKYRQLQATEFGHFRTKVPIIATWDDHDYGQNDSGEEYPLKRESKEIFLDFFKEPTDSRRWGRHGIYTSYYYGKAPHRLQVILFDLRWHRGALVGEPGERYSPNPDPNVKLLGEEQWRWFENELRQPADYRIVCSSIQVVSSDHGWEKWANFPLEKMRLYSLIDQLKLKNLVFVSGDMHFGELSHELTPGGTDVYDLTASGLTHVDPAEGIENPNRLAIFDSERHFGLVTVNWRSGEIDLKIKDIDGRIVIQKRLGLNK